MTTLAYTPRGMPTQLLKDLLNSYWDTRGGNIPKPAIIENKENPNKVSLAKYEVSTNIITKASEFRKI